MGRELQKEQKRSFYALEQLRQTAEAILRGSQRLLKCRAGVEKYRTAQPQRAYAYYLELQKTRETRFLRRPATHSGIFWNWRNLRLPKKPGSFKQGLRPL